MPHQFFKRNVTLLWYPHTKTHTSSNPLKILSETCLASCNHPKAITIHVLWINKSWTRHSYVHRKPIATSSEDISNGYIEESNTICSFVRFSLLSQVLYLMMICLPTGERWNRQVLRRDRGASCLTFHCNE